MLYDRPLSLGPRSLEDDPERPLSAMDFGYRDLDSSMDDSSREAVAQDVDMEDACPSTAPP